MFCVDVAHSVHVRNEFVLPECALSMLTARRRSRSARQYCRGCIRRNRSRHQLHGVDGGFRLPAIGCIVLARPTKQLGLFRQMAGRGLRSAPGKSNLILIDHSGAVYRHGLLEDRIDWTLEVPNGPKTRRKKPGARRRLPVRSSAANVAPCVRPAKHAGIAASCRSAAEAIVFADGELARVDRNGRPIDVVRPGGADALAWNVRPYRHGAPLQAGLGGAQVQGKVRLLAAAPCGSANRAVPRSPIWCVAAISLGPRLRKRARREQ